MIIAVLTTVTWLAACTSIPKEHFDAYQQSFAQVKVSTEDMLLQARARTEAWSEHPNNTMAASKRVQRVIAWLKSLDDRQSALDTIDHYNTALVRLAAGEDPEAMEGSLKGIANGLTSFNSSSLSASVVSSVPYFGVAAKLLTAIEGQSKREEFKRLVAEAQRPMTEIVQILIADASNLRGILDSELELKRNVLNGHIVDIKFRFNGLGTKFKTSAELKKRYKQHNELRGSLNADPKLKATKHTPGAIDAGASDLEVFTLIIEEERGIIAQANALTTRIESQKNVTKAYVAALEAMEGFFVAMNTDLKQGKRQAAHEFVRRGLEYRQAIIEVREGE